MSRICGTRADSGRGPATSEVEVEVSDRGQANRSDRGPSRTSASPRSSIDSLANGWPSSRTSQARPETGSTAPPTGAAWNSRSSTPAVFRTRRRSKPLRSPRLPAAPAIRRAAPSAKPMSSSSWSIRSRALTSGDYEVADLLRRTDKPTILGANKADNLERRDSVYEFYELGLGEPIALSAFHGTGTGDLLDAIVEALPHSDEDEEEFEGPAISIVGRPNVGKSRLLNALLGQERAIVSDVPGTTRDSLDTHLEWNGSSDHADRHRRYSPAWSSGNRHRAVQRAALDARHRPL